MNVVADKPWRFQSLPRDGWMLTEGVLILMYHKVARPPVSSNLPGLYVSPGCFRRQMDGLARSGAACLAFSEAAGAAAAGRTGFCITFDDGYRNAFEAALPWLAARRLRAIQFIVAGAIGRDDAWDRPGGEPPQPLMDDCQIREWLGAGHEIGSHTLTHPPLAKIPLADARTEIFDSKKLLEDRFGRRVDHFCYPYGDWNPRVRDLAAEAGYTSACVVEAGSNAPGADPYALRRVMACEGGFPPDLGTLASAGLRAARQWRRRPRS